MYRVLLIFIFYFVGFHAFSQEWNLVKEKNGIRVYSASQQGSNLHQYKAVTEVDADLMTSYRQVVSFEENRAFLDRIETLRKLEYIEDSLYMNYMVFDLPWPFSDRDVIVNMKVQISPGRILLTSTSDPLYLPEKESIVRITDFAEKWEIKAINSNRTLLTVSGHADPSGSIPAWVSNLFIANEPYNFLYGLKGAISK